MLSKQDMMLYSKDGVTWKGNCVYMFLCVYACMHAWVPESATEAIETAVEQSTVCTQNQNIASAVVEMRYGR